RRLAGSEEVAQGRRRLVGVSLLVLDEVRQVNVRAPVLWLGYQAGRPQVGEGHFVILEKRRAVGEGEGRQLQGLGAERIHQVADAGPDEQIDDAVRKEILYRAMRAGIDVGERVWERT